MSHLPRRYAQALQESGCPIPPFNAVCTFLFAAPPLWDALCAPNIHNREKENLLRALPALSQDARILRFFLLLVEARRVPLLPEIVEELRLLELDAQHACECHVTCVSIPSAPLQERLCARLSALHNKPQVRLVFHIDPAILGGFILHIDGMSYDQSVRGKLNSLATHLEEVNAL